MRSKLLFSTLIMSSLMGTVAQAQTSPVPVPTSIPASPAGGVTAESQLQYRDPSTPLTIGEMSSLQGKKLDDDFLRKLGFTTKQPVVLPSAKASSREPDSAARQRPKTSIKLLSTFGPTAELSAELMVNGTMRTVRPGDGLVGGILIADIKSDRLVLQSPKGKTGKLPKQSVLLVGEIIEFSR